MIQRYEPPAPRSSAEIPAGYHHFHFNFVGLDWAFIDLARSVELLGFSGDYFSPFGYMEVAFQKVAGSISRLPHKKVYDLLIYTPADESLCRELKAAVGQTADETATFADEPCLDCEFRTNAEVLAALDRIRNVEQLRS